MHRLSLLVDLAALLPRRVDLDDLLGTACRRIADALDADRASLWLLDDEGHDLVTRVATLPEVDELRLPLGRGVAGHVAASGEPVRLDDAHDDPRFDPAADRATGYRTRTMLAVPMCERADAPVRGVLQVLNRRAGTFTAEDERYLEALAAQLAAALALTTLRARDTGRRGVTRRGRFNRVVGRSDAMAHVYERVALAAETDATVLLSGETGTGKTLLARAIHDNSARSSRPFVTVDCTTLAPQLIESELFGHERGAFTGADRRVPGRIEAAADGTLFLDEIGDLPLEVQGKLLRVLQDREYERVGGRETQATAARILTATHRDLARLVQAGGFRKDLFYRVRVVQIAVPPLRDRGDRELGLLVEHFAELYARRHGRPVPVFEDSLMTRVLAHPWPGNVRELEHWVESCVVLSRDGRVGVALSPIVDFPTASNAPPVGGFHAPLNLELADTSRRYAEAVLADADGNKSEAARRLGVSRNRLARLLAGGE